MQGKEVIRPCTAIRLFSMCDAMKWAHLPVAGGIYDQHPDLMDQFMYIFQQRSLQQERERKAEERKRNQSKMRGKR